MTDSDSAEIDVVLGLVNHTGHKVRELDDSQADSTFYSQFAVLRYQAHILVNELLALHPDNDHARIDSRHKIRQHTDGLQDSLSELGIARGEPDA